jgi:acyl-CoA reductase-like NAD-dependent aldehyde dehydrogenase
MLCITNPCTGEVIAEIAAAAPDQIPAAVQRSRRAQTYWAQTSATERRNRLIDWRHALLKAGDEVALQLSRENGKPLHESWLHEVAPLCDTLNWLTEQGPRLLEDTDVSLRWMKHQRSVLWSKPRGVCVVIAPYNFPLLIPFSDAAAALMAGCSVIIKPSERTPLIAQAVARLAEQSGLEPDLLQILPGGPDVAQQLITADVDEVVFTGNTAHGREVAMLCADRLLPCTLELGGGAPAVVLEDANVEQAATAITFGALANSGQSCIGIERVFAAKSLYPKLMDAIADRVHGLRQGNPLQAEVDLGALTSPQQLTLVNQQVAAALADGARLICGGKRACDGGNFYLPTVLGDCDPRMQVVAHETFGPVIPLVAVEDPGTILEIAALGRSALAAYLFGRDGPALTSAARNANANHVLVNDVLWSYLCPELPFGGRGRSGWGVVHGPQGLLSHTHRAHIGRVRLQLPTNLGFTFPYGKTPRTLLKQALRFFTH